jgi:hypothetical protein
VDRFVTRSVVLATVGALLLGGWSDPAHDPAEWAGVPWSLRDAQLPDDKSTVLAWLKDVHRSSFEGVRAGPPFTITRTQVLVSVSFSVSGREGAEVGAAWLVPDKVGQVCDPLCHAGLECDRCTTADMLRAVVAQHDPVQRVHRGIR